MLTRNRAPAALTPPAIRPGRGGPRAGFGSLALALALAALGPSTGPPTMAAHRVASRAASLPPYSIEALRARRYPGGRLALGVPLRRGAGFTVYRMSWPSGGQTMTGSIEIPAGRGPFPVVLVAHGYIAPAAYVVGLDSWRYGDALAAHGFIVAAPDYPGHAGSGPGPAGLPAVVGIAVTVGGCAACPALRGSAPDPIGLAMRHVETLTVVIVDAQDAIGA